jgi:alkanesulfonate monooxygenase SsuD/methylene tetrahydromethanopterin reductase-like flavin-dependent oxidoreductase (luciferase family)
MQIGLFDHVEHGDRPLARLFDERLRFVEAAEAAGIYCLHVAEHHATPLNMVPVPGVYLGAVARTVKRLRLGPLVYLLPLYSPLRLIEEICMLDHLSHGRLDVGIGRGVSPYELKYHKVEHDRSRDIFIDAFKCVHAGLTTDRLSYEGEHYTYKDVPIELRPLQEPHPPFWYGSSNEIGSTWAGEQGLHFVTLGPMPTAKANINAYKAALNKRAGCAQGGIFRWRGDRRAAARFRCRHRRGGASLRQAGDGPSSRALELAARQAWRDRAHVAAERAARRQLRGLRRGSHRNRRLAGDGPRRARAASPRARRQLSADLSFSRHHVA